MHAGQGTGLTARNLGNCGASRASPSRPSQIPQTPVSPMTAYIGAQPNLATESPFIVLNFIIALQGIFPSRN